MTDQTDYDQLRAVVARIRQMTDYWEQQLPEVIRTPAVVSAIRAALEPAAVLPAPTDQTAEQLASLAVNAGRAFQDEKRHYEIACQENARLRATIERVRRLHDALDTETALTSPDDEITRGAAARKIAAALDGWTDPAELRRMAGEAQQAPASVVRSGQPETDTQPADTAQQPETPDVVAAIVSALQERPGELSELAEEQMRPSLEERAQEWLEAADVARRAAKAAVGAPAPFTPPAHYRRDDGVDCCVHIIPVGPDSCRHCRELHDDEPPADTAQQPKEA